MQNDGYVLLSQQQTLLFDGEQITTIDAKESAKHLSAVTLPSFLIESLSFKLSKSLSDQDLQIQVEMKMYKDGGLNVEEDYAIDFLKYDVGDEYLVEAFAISKAKFMEYIKEFDYAVSVVDFTIVRFLMYQSLYTHGYPANTNDLIIYMSENEAFGVIYQNGKYIGHRTLNTLEKLSKKTGIELVKLKEYLQTKGFIKSKYNFDETHIIDAVQEIVLKDIEKLVYSINHKRSMFGLNGIDNIYIDFYGQDLAGIEEFFLPFGYELMVPKAIDLSPPSNIDNSRYLELLYLQDAQEKSEEVERLELSLLERKKPLYQYMSVKYGAVIGLSLFLSLGVYGYLMYQESLLDDTIAQKSEKLKVMKSKSKKLLTQYKKLKDKNQKLLLEKEKISKEVQVYETTLDILPMMETQKKLRQQFMNDVVASLAKYKLNTQYIYQHDTKSMELMLVSEFNNRDTIAKFMNDLARKNYSSVSTKKIEEAFGIYKSKVRIER